MRKIELTPKQKLMLFGLVKYPNLTDKQLSEKINLKHSTVTAIRHKLREKDYFRTLNIPILQSLGCKMLVVIYTSFSPLIPLEERVDITGRTIEVFDEIFFSIGEQDKGFSISLSKDYATIGRINDIRTQTFGGRGLLEDQYPHMIVFPFEISRIYRFFDYSYLLKNSFNLDHEFDESFTKFNLKDKENVFSSDNEKEVFCMLIKYPEMSDTAIASEVGVSRHTVSRLRRKFEQKNLINKINLPDIKKLGFEILAFYHISYDPSNPPDIEKDDSVLLISDSAIFMATRQFEAFMLCVYNDYEDFNKDKTRILQVLKENKWIAEDPNIITYSLNELIFIKDFKFAPITGKIIGYDIRFL